MILPIINSEITVGDVFSGNVDGCKVEVFDIKEPYCYRTSSGRLVERKEPLVIMRDLKSGKTFETNLITAKTLLLTKQVT